MTKLDSGFIGYIIGILITTLISYLFIVDKEEVVIKYNKTVFENDSLKQELSDCNIRNGRYFHALIYKDQNKVKYDSIITIIAKDN